MTNRLTLLLLAGLGVARIGGAADRPGLVRSEFIFRGAPFPSCHASTIAETRSGLVAAWFGGTREGHPDVRIWVSRRESGGWTRPVAVAEGSGPAGDRLPTWNPVLFQPREGPLLLFYKVGPGPGTWWGMLRTSGDGGLTWSPPRRLSGGVLGPVKNKPVQLADGDLLCGSSTEGADGWRVRFERTADFGATWTVTPALNDGTTIGAIQPSILVERSGALRALGRTRQGRVFEIRSADGGRSWGPMTLTALPNPSSGIDAVTLQDGRHLLVYNHSGDRRSPLNVAVSADGAAWQAALVLEDDAEAPNGFSYPAVIQTADGLVHVTYTWRRELIKHVVIAPARLRPLPMSGDPLQWPATATPER